MRSGLSRFGRPKVGPGSGGVACNLGISGEFPAYTSGAAYTGTVSITGGTPPYTVELITESTPGAGGGSGGGSGGSGPGGGSGGGLIPDGALYGAYVNTPYYVLADEGFQANLGSWTGRTAGLPENITGDGQFLFGYPTTAGTSTVVITGGAVFSGLTDYVRSLTVLPSPSFTVLSPFDRSLQAYVPKFLPGPAPYLSVTSRDDAGGVDGYRMVRAVNGRTTGKHYWEVAVTTLPAGARFGAGLDASNQNGVTFDTQQLGDTAGQWGFTQNGATALAISNSGSTSTTAVVQGDVLCFAADLALGRLWVRRNGGAWIGGGDPATNTSPTFSGLTIPAGSFWGDYRPCVMPGLGVTLTANFGSQPFAHAVPATFTGWPWAQVSEMRSQVWDSDTNAWAKGDPTIYTGPGPVNPTGKISQNGIPAIVTGSTASFIITGADPSILGSIAKSTGKWQFELEIWLLRQNRVRVGLVDATWTNTGIESSSTFPVVGDASGSIGLLANSSLSTAAPGFPAKVYVGGAEVGTFTEVSSGQVITFACDLDANTVAIYVDGALQGTYNLPSGVKPWRIGMSGKSGGGYILRTSQLSHPVATFTNWGP